MCGKLFQHKGVLNKHIRTIHEEKKPKKEKKKRPAKKTIPPADVETKQEVALMHEQPMQTIQVGQAGGKLYLKKTSTQSMRILTAR